MRARHKMPEMARFVGTVLSSDKTKFDVAESSVPPALCYDAVALAYNKLKEVVDWHSLLLLHILIWVTRSSVFYRDFCSLLLFVPYTQESNIERNQSQVAVAAKVVFVYISVLSCMSWQNNALWYPKLYTLTKQCVTIFNARLTTPAHWRFTMHVLPLACTNLLVFCLSY